MFCATLTSIRLMVAASGKLHQHMLNKLLRSPMSFYEVTPMGAIISRVGKVLHKHFFIFHLIFIMFLGRGNYGWIFAKQLPNLDSSAA